MSDELISFVPIAVNNINEYIEVNINHGYRMNCHHDSCLRKYGRIQGG